MLLCKCSGVAISLVILALLSGAATGLAPPVPVEQPPAKTIAELIAQLNATDFRSRQLASDKLEQFGSSVLPPLRKAAAAASTGLEVKRRIELVVFRIENTLIKNEEKRWQDLDAPRRGIKDRLVKILAKTPALNDHQVATAVYLLSVGRPPTDAEVRQAQKQFEEPGVRRASALQLARPLVQNQEFSAAVAAANGRLLKAQKDLAGEREIAKGFRLLNGPEFQKMMGDIAAALAKVAKTDEQFIDLAFLLMLSRFPEANEAKAIVAHLKKATTTTTDIIWALMNSKEFLVAQ